MFFPIIAAAMASARLAQQTATSVMLNGAPQAPNASKGKWVVRYHTSAGAVDSAPLASEAEAIEIAKGSAPHLRPTVVKL